MKKTIIAITIILSALPAFAEKMRVAVMDFQADGVPDATARRVSELIRGEMINSGQFVVIERGQMDAILDEQGFQQTGCTDVSCAVKMGQMLSANKMLLGTVMKMGESIIITGRIVDVEKAVGEFSEDHKANSEMELYPASKEFAKKLTIRIMQGAPAGVKYKPVGEDNWWFGIGWGAASMIFGDTITMRTGNTVFYKEEHEYNSVTVFNFNITYKQKIEAVDFLLFGIELAFSNHSEPENYTKKFTNITDEYQTWSEIQVHYSTELTAQIALKPRIYLSGGALAGWEHDWLQPYLGVTIGINFMDTKFGSWKNSTSGYNVEYAEDSGGGTAQISIAPFLGAEFNITKSISLYAEAGYTVKGSEVEDAAELYVAETNFNADQRILTGFIWGAGVKYYF